MRKEVLRENTDYATNPSPSAWTSHAPSNNYFSIKGWKVIDLTQTKPVHVSEMLGTLPERVYYGLEEVTQALKNGTSK